MGIISSSNASLVTSPPRRSILLPTRITGTWTTSQPQNWNILQIMCTLTPSWWNCGNQYVGIRSNEFGLSMEYTTHITCALRISDSRCSLSCGLADILKIIKQVDSIETDRLTAWINDVSCYIFWRYFWRYSDFWHNMLDLRKQNFWIPLGQTNLCHTHEQHRILWWGMSQWCSSQHPLLELANRFARWG